MKEEIPQQQVIKKEFNKESWKPRTELGKKIKAGEIKDIDDILDKGQNILEE